MPITTELQNTKELREAGFTQPQAEKLAELFERSVQQGFEKFAEVLESGLKDIRSELEMFRQEVRGEIAQVRTEIGAIRGELKQMESGLEARLVARIESARADLLKSQNEMLFKMFGIVVGVVSLAVAIIKLFPNLY